jgi:hypothetical protein
MPPAVDMLVVFILNFSVALWRDDGKRTALVQILSQPIDIECLVAHPRLYLGLNRQLSERAVLRLIQVSLDDGQFDALVSFTFNLGAGALQRSTLRRKINRKEYCTVPAELRRWVWADGRKLRGLMRRREAEANIYSASRNSA